MLGLAAVPAVLQLFGMLLLLPETPRWVFKVGKNQKGMNILKQIYDVNSLGFIETVEEVKREARFVIAAPESGFTIIFRDYRKCLVIGCGLQMFQQLGGFNTVMYYGPEIMRQAGFGSKKGNERMALISSLPLTGMNAFGCIIALFFIDRFGRRFIMKATLPFISLSMFLIALGFYFNKT